MVSGSNVRSAKGALTWPKKAKTFATKPKRKLSKAGRAAIVAALKKAWLPKKRRRKS